MASSFRKRPFAFPVKVGAFLSLIALVTGIAGCFMSIPLLLQWRDSVNWDKAPGEILTGGVIYTNHIGGGRSVRPHFTWKYEIDGRTLEGEGYGITEVSTTVGRPVRSIVEAYPPGKKVEVLVNPADPGQSALERETPGRLIALFVPPFFLLMGLAGAFFTVTGWLGWYAEGTRNPVGRAGRWIIAFLIRPRVIMAMLVGACALAMGALILHTMRTGNFAGVLFAVFLAWCLLRVAKVVKSRRGVR
jgi:hypothetical protein